MCPAGYEIDFDCAVNANTVCKPSGEGVTVSEEDEDRLAETTTKIEEKEKEVNTCLELTPGKCAYLDNELQELYEEQKEIICEIFGEGDPRCAAYPHAGGGDDDDDDDDDGGEGEEGLEWIVTPGIKWCSGANDNVGDIWGTGMAKTCPLIGDIGVETWSRWPRRCAAAATNAWVSRCTRRSTRRGA